MILVKGINITDLVTEVNLRMKGGKSPRVAIEMAPDDLEINLGDCELEIDDSKPNINIWDKPFKVDEKIKKNRQVKPLGEIRTDPSEPPISGTEIELKCDGWRGIPPRDLED